MKCVCCHAELGKVEPKPSGKGGQWPLCGTCRHEQGDSKYGEKYSALLKPPPVKPLPSGLRSTPTIGFELETTIRVNEAPNLDEKVAFVWNKHGAGGAVPRNDKLYVGSNWSLTLDLDAVSKIKHVEYVTEPLQIGNAAHRIELIRSISDIAELSRYYYTYLVHKQGATGERMSRKEMWIAFGHAMDSHQQRAWLEERFAHSTLSLKDFRPGTLAYMVEGMGVAKLANWPWQTSKQVHLAGSIKGAPQATVDIPIGQVFRFLETLSVGSLTLSGQPVPLFRQEDQAEALRSVVRRVRLLAVSEAQRGLIAMMAFYVQVAALQKIRVTFCKESYPILNRCGFAGWLGLVDATGTFKGQLKDYLQEVTFVDGKNNVIDNQHKMIPEKWCELETSQNPYRGAWVDSVLLGERAETLKVNTKKGWWKIKDNQLLLFELRGLPPAPIGEWRGLCVGLYDWLYQFLTEPASGLDEKMAPPPPTNQRKDGVEQAMSPVSLAPRRPVPNVLPSIYYEMKDEDRLTQAQINTVQGMQDRKASHDEIARFLRQGGS